MSAQQPEQDEQEQPDDAHGQQWPSEAVVDAIGALGKALETVERARGRLYDFHQLTGTADLRLGDAVTALRESGLDDVADRVESELVGRNVLPDRWTFQVVEGYEDTYYRPFRELEREVREAAGVTQRHVYEARMKEQRRTHGRPGHEQGPPTT
jgi:hypothetical protein